MLNRTFQELSFSIIHLSVFSARERNVTYNQGALMEKGTLHKIPEKHKRVRRMIEDIAVHLSGVRTKGELGNLLVHEIQNYTLFDLQIIGGRLNSEIDKLPSPYRESIRPYFREQLFGKHHQLLTLHRTRAFVRMTDPISDRETFRTFCEMLPEGVFAWNDSGERNPYFHNPMNRLFYYLIAAFT